MGSNRHGCAEVDQRSFSSRSTACRSYYRNWFTGGAELHVDGKVVLTESALDPRTQISVTLNRNLTYEMDGHEIVIEKTRPLLLAGIRPIIIGFWWTGRLWMNSTDTEGKKVTAGTDLVVMHGNPCIFLDFTATASEQ